VSKHKKTAMGSHEDVSLLEQACEARALSPVQMWVCPVCRGIWVPGVVRQSTVEQSEVIDHTTGDYVFLPSHRPCKAPLVPYNRA